MKKKPTNARIKVQGTEITVTRRDNEDYISLTDMLKAKDGDFFISDWLRNRNTVEFLGIWETVHNPNFNYASPPDEDADWQGIFPYQRLLYTAVESGAGAMLAFSMSGPRAGPVGHMIPFFGHTFNEDAWAGVAEGDYFRVGERIRYLTSDSWMSSFIAHDDNFGSNLCIPKAYLPKDNVQYVVGFIPNGFRSPGILAEISAADYFYAILPELKMEDNAWLRRLRETVSRQKLILRTVAVRRDEYLDHLSETVDWEGIAEDGEIVNALREFLSDNEALWMIELSIPDLFSTNQAKVGELLLDGTKEFSPELDYSMFVLARFPGIYLFLAGVEQEGPVFSWAASNIESHTPVLKRS